MVSAMVGSTTSIFWKRRVSARSFSKMPRNSWNVVEPMQRISPEPSSGLIRLQASMTPPEAEPAPMMVWISSMNRIALGLALELGDHLLQALLEVAAILGAGDQRAQIEREDHRVLEHLGHVVVDDALGQTLGQRGLADAGFADVQRIVLAPTAEHLDGALDLVGTADQRIDLALARHVVEIAGVGLQRALLLGVAAAFGLIALATGIAAPDPAGSWRCRGRCS